MKDKKRLDVLLAEKGYFKSRSKASSFITLGKVFINNRVQTKPGKMFSSDEIENVSIKETDKYVSRGGYKLEKAIEVFKVPLKGRICLDIGASTGGFTDCLLKYGAKKVYAIDVGYGQFDFNLRKDPKVVLYERTNIRYINKSYFNEKIEIVTIDVSFISVKKFLLNLLEFLYKDFCIIVLIKPQFEAEREDVKKGIIKNKEVHINVLKDFLEYLSSINLRMTDLTYSPIKGPKGNIEFLCLIKEKGRDIDLNNIKRVVDEAHSNLSLKNRELSDD